MSAGESLSTAEAMAVAVLRGDPTAAYALCDLLLEESRGTHATIQPLTVGPMTESGRVRAAVSMDADRIRGGADVAAAIANEVGVHVNDWLPGVVGVLVLPPGFRLSLYAIPEKRSD